MEFFRASLAPLALGVFSSLLFTLTTTENPARIPVRRLFFRSLYGILLFVFFWGAACFAALVVLESLLPFDRLPGLRWILAFSLGFLLPQIGRLKDRFSTSRTARYFILLQLIDEQTRLYFGRIIDREERKLNRRILEDPARSRALDRLFEAQNIDIAAERAKFLPTKAVLGIFQVRHPAVKLKYFLRHVGYDECVRGFERIAERPDLLFPHWPVDQGDRRKGDPYFGGTPPKRRKYEQADVQSYVLEVSETHVARKYQIFVSSTFLDLQKERQQALRALLRCDCIPAGMEFFPSSDEDLWSLIRGIVDDCDYYVLLIGSRYGSVTRRGISYTEAEYEYARKTGKPILAFLHTQPDLIRARSPAESLDHQRRLDAFRKKVTEHHAPGYWTEPEELCSLVQQAVERAKRGHPARGWIRAAAKTA